MKLERVSRILPGSEEAKAFAVMGAEHAVSYFRQRDILGLPGSDMGTTAFCGGRTVYGAFDVEGRCLGVSGVDGIAEPSVAQPRKRGTMLRHLVPWYAVVPAAQGRGVASVLLATMIDDALTSAAHTQSEVIGVHAWCAQDNLSAQAVAQSIGLRIDQGRVHVGQLGYGTPERAYVRLAAEPHALDLGRRVALCPPAMVPARCATRGTAEPHDHRPERYVRMRG